MGKIRNKNIKPKKKLGIVVNACTPVIGLLKQEDFKFEVRMLNIVRPHPNKNENKTII